MKIKIKTLSGIALDWAVAVVLGITTGKVVRIDDGNKLICEGILPLGVVSCDDGTFDICINKLKYSSKWDVAGPFITKYKIDIEHFDGVVASIPIEKENDSWMFSCSGSTELEAAMKCLVSKFVGEYDMDVPNEIVERFLK